MIRSVSEPKIFYRRRTKNFPSPSPALEKQDSTRYCDTKVISHPEQPKNVGLQEPGVPLPKDPNDQHINNRELSSEKPLEMLTNDPRSVKNRQGTPHDSGGEESCERLFISHLKATFNIQGQMPTQASRSSGGHPTSSRLKESPEKKTLAVNKNNPSPDAENARQLDRTVQIFIPEQKPDSAQSPSTNNLNLCQDVSHSSPPSPSSPSSLHTVRKSSSSVPPTPSRTSMGFKTVGSNGNEPELGNYGGGIPVSETGPGPEMVSKDDVQGIIMGGPALSPTRQGTFATQGRPEVIEHRGVPSMHGAIGIAGGWEQNLCPPNWQRLSAPYSPSIYDTASTPLCPDFGVNYHAPEATTNRLSHVAIPIETLQRLSGHLEGLSKELGLVRAEVQAQTFQLQQLTAHVNILRYQNCAPEVHTQFSVPTPTAAFRTPPSTGSEDNHGMSYTPGSPIHKHLHNQHHQRDMSDSTIRHNGTRLAVPQQPMLPYPQLPPSSENQHYVPAPLAKNTPTDEINQSVAELKRNSSVRKIVFGQTQQDNVPIPQRSPVLRHGHANQPRPPHIKTPVFQQNHPLVVNSGTHHRRNSSTRSKRNFVQLNPFVPPFRPGNNDPEDNLTRAEFGYNDSHHQKAVGTWGGTRNWYHEAYGNGSS